MTIRKTFLCFSLLLIPTVAWAGPPDADAILKGALDAVGGEQAFQELGILEISITEEETRADGQRHKKQLTGYLNTANLTNMRLELPGNIVIARAGGESWATRDGEIDERPQTPQMASGMLNQRLFPLFLPYTLGMGGVTLSDVTESSFEGEPSWRIAVRFREKFFMSASMSTTWYVHVRRSDHAVLAIEFLPPVEFRQVATEGVRYRTLKQTETKGSQLPSQILVDGIDFDGSPTGHVRVTKLSIRVLGPNEPALFLHPVVLKAIEGG
jgi:hypothetical protein